MALCERCGKPRPRQAERFCSLTCYHSSHSTRPAEERFWPKVNKDGPVPPHVPDLGPCWVWTGAGSRTGYPNFGANPYNPTRAYRYSWELHNGPIPLGLEVCHRCDNPPCVRPTHLFLGTHAENMRDAKTKGRVFNLGQWAKEHPDRHRWAPVHGEAHPRAKLTREAVAKIRASWPAVSQNALAREFGVTQGVIWKVIHNKAWIA